MGDLDRVTFGGETVDRRTSNMLREAQRIANEQDPSIGKFKLSQGCFCHGVAASAGTHNGAGAFDLSVRGYSEHEKEVIALSLRKVGFASWRRMPSQGPWPEHIHGIAMGSKQLPPIAQSQVRSYLNGRDGLVGNRRDNQDRPDKVLTWEQYKTKYLDGDDKPDVTPAADTADPAASDPTDAADPYDIDAGHGVSATRDSDGDGLTDDFEKMSSTNPLDPDTDGDGITDGQEFVTSGGRGYGLAIDADHDGIADWLETGALNSASTGVATGALGGHPTGTGAGVAAGIGSYAGSSLGPGMADGIGGTDIGGGAGTGTSTGLPAGAAGVGNDPLDPGGADPFGG